MNKTPIAALAAFLLSGIAIAADAPADHPRWNRADMEQRHAQREARRIDDMAVLLGLRPDQKPALTSYLQSLRPPHDEAGGMHRADPGRPSPADMTTPARLDAMAARADARDTMLKQKIAATRQFYASLSPEQQRRFDALDDLRRDRMHGGHGRMGGWHRPDGPGAPPPPAA
ncbi:Spy/CpxP family protein refolding chaperone [Sphingomonas sp. CGMCC 1.13654]|uniref:Spy/CpxP family protein refolding chaperone n=1 Tax=Sphingomonas chungangi TaxID=2683589 RepID=A0A838L3B7_9SPHN|nr:Spy/CpxP family protein refolding chaperone [Sphingomonas chungangi]MBA2933420.1 Spy/CpxP family protein refolding chaperone [Sphingomonas chungangi]